MIVSIMNDFERKIQEVTCTYLQSYSIETLQVNVGTRCDNSCVHCHIQAGPERTEIMDTRTIGLVLEAAQKVKPKLIDITGGAPELNPHLCDFIRTAKKQGHNVQVRTNLTVLLQPEMERIIEFYCYLRIKLVASLPCYLKKEVDSQRGEGVFERSIEVLKLLNKIGYGRDQNLILDLVFNPEAAFLPPEQAHLESEYKEELYKNFGIVFNNLITITNMPVGRFLQYLRKRHQYGEYDRLLRDSFNPRTNEKLMCRNQIDVGWDGTIYDCDFNLALGLPVGFGIPKHIGDLDPAVHSKRRIVTGNHCFGCAAGHGSSCSGALD